MDLLRYLALLTAPVLFGGLAFILMLHYEVGKALKIPIDGGRTIRGRPILGANKTYLGLVAMPALTALSGLLIAAPFSRYVSSGFQKSPGTLIAFGMLGLAYALGEIPNSFLKRQLDIPPGRRGDRLPFRVIFDILDAIDSLLAVGLVYLFVFRLDIYPLILLLPIGGLIHLATDWWMRQLRLKR